MNLTKEQIKQITLLLQEEIEICNDDEVTKTYEEIIKALNE